MQTIRAPSLTDSLTRRLPRNQTVTVPGSHLKPKTHEHLERSRFTTKQCITTISQFARLIIKVDPWCDLLTSYAHNRGRGYRQIKYTLQRQCTLPTLRNTWPRTTIRVDQSIPTKPSLCHALSPATATISLSGLGLGWPRVYQRHQRPPSWQNGPKQGQGTIKTKRAHKVMSAYRARVCRPITFPRGRHR